MSKDKLMFLPSDKDAKNFTDLTGNTNNMVMIKTRINGFEQTINIPLGGAKYHG
jgi:hypothetical protein